MRLVDLGGDQRRAAAVRVVEEHHCSVRLLQLILRRALSGKGQGEG